MNRRTISMRRTLAALLLGLTIAGSMAAPVTSLPVCAAETESTYRYAVQLYGIHMDALEGNVKGGLTFGPALGKDYTSSYGQHDPYGETASGHAHRCMHQDTWAEVIKYSYDDPYIYEQCLEKGCTKAVPLRLTNENASSNDKTRVFHTGKAAQYPDGDGVSTLYYELWESARVYGIDGSGANDEHHGGKLYWENSQLRAVLNGEQTVSSDFKYFTQNVYTYNAKTGKGNSMLAAFPEELQAAIGKKAVAYASDMQPSENQYAVVYDRLWLLSNIELYGNADGSLESYQRDSNGSKVGFVGEGTQYQRTRNAGVRVDQENASIVAYKAAHSAQSYWTRSRYYDYGAENTWTNEYCSAVFANGSITYSNMSYSTQGVSPCFTLTCDPTFRSPTDSGDSGDSGSGHHSDHASDSGSEGTAVESNAAILASDALSDELSSVVAATEAAAADTAAPEAAGADGDAIGVGLVNGSGNAISTTGDDSAIMTYLAIASAAAILLVSWHTRRRV